MSSFITYLLTSRGIAIPETVIESKERESEIYSTEYTVRRRYSDFEWLYIALLYRYPGILIEKL